MKHFLLNGCMIVLFLSQGSSASGQSGSTGGTLGKTSKSVSGSGSAPIKKPSVRNEQTRKGYSMNGTWHVRQKCNTGQFEIILTLRHSSTTSFSGSGKGLTTGASTQVIAGHLAGRRFTFRRPGGLSGDSWAGTLSSSGASLSGSTQGALWQCTFAATRR